jgi:hypothetical protein
VFTGKFTWLGFVHDLSNRNESLFPQIKSLPVQIESQVASNRDLNQIKSNRDLILPITGTDAR